MIRYWYFYSILGRFNMLPYCVQWYSLKKNFWIFIHSAKWGGGYQWNIMEIITVIFFLNQRKQSWIRKTLNLSTNAGNSTNTNFCFVLIYFGCPKNWRGLKKDFLWGVNIFFSLFFFGLKFFFGGEQEKQNLEGEGYNFI